MPDHKLSRPTRRRRLVLVVAVLVALAITVFIIGAATGHPDAMVAGVALVVVAVLVSVLA